MPTHIDKDFQCSAWPDNSSHLLYHKTSWGNLAFYLIIRSHNVNSWGGKLRIVGVQFPFWPRHIYSKLNHFFPAVHCNHAPFYLCFAFQDIFSEINVLAYVQSTCFKNVSFLKHPVANIEEAFNLILSIFCSYDKKVWGRFSLCSCVLGKPVGLSLSCSVSMLLRDCKARAW